MSRSFKRSLSGFTLVELLVVIAIIGILVALLLPAIQAAREAARRSQCQNNMKNLGLAMLNFEQTKKQFPAGVQTEDHDATGNLVGQLQSASDGQHLYANWAIQILPFMEEQPLYDSFVLKRADAPGYLQTLTTNNISTAASGGKPADSNLRARSTELPVMLCPTDDGRGRPYDGGNLSGGLWARGNYGYNFGLGMILFFPDVWSHQQLDNDGQLMLCGRGVGGVSAHTAGGGAQNFLNKIATITDGTSHTIALAELRTGRSPVDRRGVWAMEMIGSNLLGQHGSNFVAGPNDCNPGGDDLRDNKAIIASVGGESTLIGECMDPYNSDSWNHSVQVVARSKHVGGLFATMCDGSVQFISDFIDAGQLNPGVSCKPENFGVWQRLNCPEDGLPINDSGQ